MNRMANIANGISSSCVDLETSNVLRTVCSIIPSIQFRIALHMTHSNQMACQQLEACRSLAGKLIKDYPHLMYIYVFEN